MLKRMYFQLVICYYIYIRITIVIHKQEEFIDKYITKRVISYRSRSLYFGVNIMNLLSGDDNLELENNCFN